MQNKTEGREENACPKIVPWVVQQLILNKKSPQKWL